ncbi:TonB-dependent receptor [Mucilaginibacter sp. RS28]|uniref:TonB-dependent receptor n=1 Tax=Mucilaginibacter straminoryzae TaxID=2932774 RepID=A0A9X1X1R1_9SPHI|nr:TonB-dependent receptor [Mucilaginibacter straminoryzae]MCJ8209577.1 TonB-dependent receptor [Mucilaginibacter straminoryzae]
MKNIVPSNWAQKLILFMKVSTLVLSVILFTTLNVSATVSMAQEVLNKRVTINLKSERLSEALDDISAATNVKFTYNGTVTNSRVKVSVTAKNQQLGELLEQLLQKVPFTYTVLDDEILIKFDLKKQNQLNAQRILTGKVIDEKGQVLPGVTVKVKGTDRGAITDIRGNYQVQINDNTEVLVFSFVGYKTQEITVGDQKVVDVKLEPAPQSELKEVAVVAYGTQRKISLIGAQSTVDVEDLKQPVASVTSLLAGRVSGVVGIQRSGLPGKDGADIYIRGMSNFVSSTNISPLIMVDGVERSINNIDIEDIQSFTILKDASATAVYGVRGANGVVLVQTKRGKAGKPKINADYYEGVGSFTKIPKMADGNTYMNMVNEALTTRGQAAKYTQDYINNTVSGKAPLLYPDVNWVDELFKTYNRQRRANLHVTGGVPSATYYVSTSYFNQTGLLNTDNLQTYNSGISYNRYNFVTNLDLQITKTTKLAVGARGFVGKGNYPSQDPSTIFSYALTVPPVEYPKIYPGNIVPGKTANGSEPNPYGQLTQTGYSTEYNSQINSQMNLTQDLSFWVPGLNFNTLFSYDTGNGYTIKRSKDPDTYLADSNKPYNADGTLNLVKTYTGSGNFLNFSSNSSGSYAIYWQSSLNYDHTFGKHHVGGLLLYNQREVTNYPASSYISFIPHRERGYAARGTYSFKDRYFAEVNLGYNGSENFAPEHRYGLFPAFGIGWLLSEEPFFKSLKPTLSMFKLRYSDGLVGYDDSGGPRFGYMTVLNNSSAGYTYGLNRNGISGIAVDTYGVNSKWAKSHKQNLGVDLSLFNKINLTADAFKEHRTGVMMQRTNIPTFVGLTTPPFGNIGVIDNKGIDATLTGDVNIGKFLLNLRGTVTYSKSKIIENDQPTPPYPWMNTRGTTPTAVFGYIADGLFTSQAEIDRSAVPGDKSKVKPGDIKYRDLNGDGLINAYDKTKISDGDFPALVFGFGFNAQYKNFYLNTFFQGAGKTTRLLYGTAIQPFSTNNGISNAYANITDRWTPENPSQNVFYPRLAYGEAENANNTPFSTWWLKDISYIRLKTLDFGYNLPKTFLSNLGVKSSTVYLEGYNLLTFSSFKLWDPELGTLNGTAYPNVKTLVLGVKFQFN